MSTKDRTFSPSTSRPLLGKKTCLGPVVMTDGGCAAVPQHDVDVVTVPWFISVNPNSERLEV